MKILLICTGIAFLNAAPPSEDHIGQTEMKDSNEKNEIRIAGADVTDWSYAPGKLLNNIINSAWFSGKIQTAPEERKDVEDEKTRVTAATIQVKKMEEETVTELMVACDLYCCT